MITNHIKIDEAFWGSVAYCIMPAPDIYHITTRGREGYAVSKDYSGSILSPKALSFGTEHKKILYFPSEETMCIVDHALLVHRMRSCYNAKEMECLKEQLALCQQCGQLDQPAYFGEYPPPRRTPAGIVDAFHRVGNGFYFARSNEEWWFSICQPIGDGELTIPAQNFGQWEDDYLFFDIPTCAVPIFELQSIYKDVEAIVRSHQALYTVLWDNFTAFTRIHNEETENTNYQIPQPHDSNVGKDFLITLD